MSRFLHLATILSLAACEHAAPATTPQPQPVAPPPPTEAAVKVAPAVAVPQPQPQTVREEPLPCRVTRAGTCWGQTSKVRVVKKAATDAPVAEPAAKP